LTHREVSIERTELVCTLRNRWKNTAFTVSRFGNEWKPRGKSYAVAAFRIFVATAEFGRLCVASCGDLLPRLNARPSNAISAAIYGHFTGFSGNLAKTR
jgi:hypothetical protein